MSKFRLLYLSSVSLLVILLAAAVWRPFSATEDHRQVQHLCLLQDRQGWILQFELLNHGELDAVYEIAIDTGGTTARERVKVRPAGCYIYKHHIGKTVQNDERETIHAVSLAVYRPGNPVPVEECTIHLSGQPGAIT